MANINQFIYNGLGPLTRGTCGGTSGCPNNMYGCCATPAGPDFPSLGYARPPVLFNPWSPQQVSMYMRSTQPRPQVPVVQCARAQFTPGMMGVM
jgi:hypothetical protein